MSIQLQNQNIDFEKEMLEGQNESSKKVKKEEKMIKHFLKNSGLYFILSILIIIIIIGGSFYWKILQSRIYIENATISAPHINITPSKPGILKKVFVQEGDFVKANQQVALVGNEILRTKIDGLVIQVKNTPGEIINPGIPVIVMINPQELRVIGKIEENKGLKDIKIGQRVIFKVDAYGNQKFEGVVESIIPTSYENDIVFNISNKRQEKVFEVKVQYDDTITPQFLDGMSAKMWIYK